MQLLTPDIGLLFWSIFSLTGFLLFVVALIGLLRNNHWPDSTTKLMWAMVIIFVPTIGPLLYLTIGRRRNKTVPQ